MTQRKAIKRRDLLKSVAAAGMVGITGTADAREPTEAITVADIAATEKLEGYAYTEAHRKLLLPALAEQKRSLAAIRKPELGQLDEPATTFDPRLPGMRFPRGKGSLRTTPVTAPALPTGEDLAFAPVTVLASLIRARKLSSAELTRSCLDRLRHYGPRLNCVVTLLEEQAMARARQVDAEIHAGRYRGPLHGIPWGAKDLLAAVGAPTTWGAEPYAKQVFDANATAVDRMEAAGAVLVAKLSLGELAMGDTWFGGLTRNPWDPAQGSSGSSAGPASALAAGLVPLAVGSETLGSIVSPSVRCGTTGLRPTYGRISRHGAMPLCWTMDKLGPMARSVEDCAIGLHALAGPDGLDPTVADIPFRWNAAAPLAGIRVGFDEAAFAELKGGEATVYSEVLDALRGLGITLRPVKLPPMAGAYNELAGLVIGVEGAASFARLTATGGVDRLAQQGPNAWPNIFRAGSLVPAADYVNALRLRRRLQVEMARAMEGIDCYVTPPFGSLVATNLTGHPTLVTRCGMAGGKPLMVEFTGALYREDAILRVGLAYEQSTNWHTQRPDLARIPAVPPTPRPDA